MTTSTPCPDIELLSRALDHEASPQEEQAVNQHLATCADCSALIARLHRATAKELVPLVSSPFLSAVTICTPSCLSPETVAAYVQRILPVAESSTVEQHLHACDTCFNEVQSAFRTAAVLSTPLKKPTPATLKARVATLWKPAKAVEQKYALSRIAIQLTEKGLHLIAQNLVAPFFNIQEVLVPAPTYRSAEAPSRLDLKLTAGQYTLAVTAVPDGNGIALALTLFGPQQESLAGQRVFLNQHGKAIFSKKTDQQGVLRVPHLGPGLYEIACPSLAATFEVEFHA